MIEHYGMYTLASLLSYVLYFESSPKLNKTEVVHIAAVIAERANLDAEGGPWNTVLQRVVLEGGQFACLWRETPNLEDYDDEKWQYCARMATLLLQQKIPRGEGYTHFFSVHGKVPFWARDKKTTRVGDTRFLRLEE